MGRKEAPLDFQHETNSPKSNATEHSKTENMLRESKEENLLDFQEKMRKDALDSWDQVPCTGRCGKGQGRGAALGTVQWLTSTVLGSLFLCPRHLCHVFLARHKATEGLFLLSSKSFSPSP
jgi:hypothetical protein